MTEVPAKTNLPEQESPSTSITSEQRVFNSDESRVKIQDDDNFTNNLSQESRRPSESK